MHGHLNVKFKNAQVLKRTFAFVSIIYKTVQQGTERNTTVLAKGALFHSMTPSV